MHSAMILVADDDTVACELLVGQSGIRTIRSTLADRTPQQTPQTGMTAMRYDSVPAKEET